MVTKLSSKKFSQKNFWKYLNLLELLLSQNSKVTDAVTILCNDSDKMIQKASIEIQNNLQKGLSVSQALSKVFVMKQFKCSFLFISFIKCSVNSTDLKSLFLRPNSAEVIFNFEKSVTQQPLEQQKIQFFFREHLTVFVYFQVLTSLYLLSLA